MSDSYSDLNAPDEYEAGYRRGMEDAVKQGLAHCVKESDSITSEQAIVDILAVLYVIHNESQCILLSLGKKEVADKFGEIVDTHIKSYRDLPAKKFDLEWV